MLDDEIALSIVCNSTPRAAANCARSSQLPMRQVIVVSNGSLKVADAELKMLLGDATIVQVQPAKGLAFCWNLAIRIPAQVPWAKQPTWTVLANDDIEFDADWLEQWEATLAEHPNALHVGMAYPANRYSCFAVHRDLVRKIGWFDERFTGIFYEDDDWHLRMSEYAQCPPGTRVHEREPHGIFAVLDCARHDHAFRVPDEAAYGRHRTLSKAANAAFFRQKWRRVKKGGWASKGKIDGEYGNYVRVLPEVEWHPLSLLGGRLK